MLESNTEEQAKDRFLRLLAVSCRVRSWLHWRRTAGVHFSSHRQHQTASPSPYRNSYWTGQPYSIRASRIVSGTGLRVPFPSCGRLRRPLACSSAFWSRQPAIPAFAPMKPLYGFRFFLQKKAATRRWRRDDVGKGGIPRRDLQKWSDRRSDEKLALVLFS